MSDRQVLHVPGTPPGPVSAGPPSRRRGRPPPPGEADAVSWSVASLRSVRRIGEALGLSKSTVAVLLQGLQDASLKS